MLLQLRCGAERTCAASSSAVCACGGGGAAPLRYDSCDEFWVDPDDRPLVGVFHIFEGAFSEGYPRPLGGRRERRQGRRRENPRREAIDGDDEVGFAGDEFVLEGQRRHGAADEEGVGLADDVVGVLEEELAGGLALRQDPHGAAPEDQLHGASAIGEEAGGDCVPHGVDFSKRRERAWGWWEEREDTREREREKGRDDNEGLGGWGRGGI